MRNPLIYAAITRAADLLEQLTGARLPPPVARLVCAAAAGHVYGWHTHPSGRGRLACALCGTVPALGSPIEPARPGCAGCAACTCRSQPWPAAGPRAW